VDIIIGRNLIRMFGTADHGRGGHDSQSYNEDVDMHMLRPGAAVRTRDADVDMEDAPALDATSCTPTNDSDRMEWIPTSIPEALETEAYRRMRVTKWVETECLWAMTR
jgi:hypothetical protein